MTGAGSANEEWAARDSVFRSIPPAVDDGGMTQFRLLRALLLFALLCLPPTIARAEESAPPGTPPELGRWVSWVLERHPEWRCARLGGAYECVWPGAVTLEVSRSGARFRATVETLSESVVPLPGRPGLLPKDLAIRSDAGPVAGSVFVTETGIAARLPPGRFTIEGAFTWDAVPAEVPVPGATALLDVRAAPDIGTGRIERGLESFRFEGTEGATASDGLTLRVLRKLVDGSPLSLETRLEFRVSGRARSVRVGRVLPEGAVPVAIEAGLPFRLQNDGSLFIQAGQGEHLVTVRAVVPQPVTEVRLPSPEIPEWPPEETLVWFGDGAFRTVEVSGASALSPELANLPADWADGASYVASRGASLKLNERTRGEQGTPPDSVSLFRTLWIDLDGTGFTAQDRITGSLYGEPRLESLPETKLGRATVSGVPALIAKAGESDLTGIELRSTALDIEAVSRIEGSGTISAVGWNTTAGTLSLDLRLPPSWTLLGVSGARDVGGSWVGSWTLLDLFLAILIFVGTYRLFGPLAALAAGFAALLFHGEFLAPRMLFVHLLLFAAWQRLVLRSEGIWYVLSRTALSVTFAAWLLQLLAFVKLQVIQLLYPQLQSGTRYRTFLQELLLLVDESFLLWPYLILLLGAGAAALRSIFLAPTAGRRGLRALIAVAGACVLVPLSTAVIFGGAALVGTDTRDGRYEQAVDAVMPERALEMQRATKLAPSPAEPDATASNSQYSYEDKVFLSGPALPAWRWRTHSISVDAPVGPDATLSFHLLPPAATRAVSAVRIGLAFLLVVVLLRPLGLSPDRLTLAARGSGIVAACVVALLFPFADAEAQMPPAELLNELEARMSARQCTANQCASITGFRLDVSGASFSAELDVTSEGTAAVTLAGPMRVLLPLAVEVNGMPWTSLRRSPDDFLVVRTPPGLSTIRVRGEVREDNSFALTVPDRPVHSVITSPDWQVEGVSASGAVEGSVRFTRKAGDGGPRLPVPPDRTDLPTWAIARRSVVVADTITVLTTVSRIGESGRATTVALPELSGERITSGGIRVDRGRVLVTIPAGASETSFSSTLPYADALRLEAEPAEGVSYEWMVRCAPFVRCTSSGLPVTQSAIDGERGFRWLPFPGERATVTIEPLKGVPGDLMTIDTLTHTVRWGANLFEGNVALAVRNTQQGTVALGLPDGAELRGVTLDGRTAAVGSGPGVNVLVNPGSHGIEVGYALRSSPGVREEVPPLRVSGTAHNVTVLVEPSGDRWVLWTGGLPWGPAVVFWNKLLVVAAVCLLLSHFRLIPLGYGGAIVLAVGLATLPLFLLPIPLLWLATLRLGPTSGRLFPRVPHWIGTTAFVLLSVLAAALFYRVVQRGLLLEPPMLVAGNQSTARLLRWYTDRAANEIPQPWVLSLPMWCWRAFALAWATWLVVRLTGWMKEAVRVVRG